MTFPFSTTVPNAPNDPADDQPFMLTNNQSTSALIDRDHVGFNNPNGGFHRQITFTANQAAPGFSTGVSDFFANTVAGLSQPFWQNASQIYQLAGIPFSSIAGNGFLTLSNGLVFQWGKVLAPGSSGNVVFPVAFPTNPPFSLVLQLQRNSDSQTLNVDSGTPPTTTGFRYLTSSAGSNAFYWIAIGN